VKSFRAEGASRFAKIYLTDPDFGLNEDRAPIGDGKRLEPRSGLP